MKALPLFSSFVSGLCTAGAIHSFINSNFEWVMINAALAGVNMFFAIVNQYKSE